MSGYFWVKFWLISLAQDPSTIITYKWLCLLLQMYMSIIPYKMYMSRILINVYAYTFSEIYKHEQT